MNNPELEDEVVEVNPSEVGNGSPLPSDAKVNDGEVMVLAAKCRNCEAYKGDGDLGCEGVYDNYNAG